MYPSLTVIGTGTSDTKGKGGMTLSETVTVVANMGASVWAACLYLIWMIWELVHISLHQ